MKKIVFYILSLLIMVEFMLIVFTGYHCMIGSFTLSDYQDEITTFSYNKNIGIISDAKTAKSKALILWKERFVEVSPKVIKKIEVLYDEQVQCWLIRGTLPPRMIGGVPAALILHDGTVLAVWHTM